MTLGSLYPAKKIETLKILDLADIPIRDIVISLKNGYLGLEVGVFDADYYARI